MHAKALIGLATLALIFGLAGCADGQQPAASEPSDQATTAPADTAATEPAGTDAGSIETGILGIVEMNATSPIDNLFALNTKKAFEELGWEVYSQDPKGDLGQANAICSQWVTRQVDVLVITTFSIDQMAQCMSQAGAANIPVFFLGSPLAEGMAGSVSYVIPAPPNDLFIQYLQDKNVTSFLSLDYTPGTPCRLRAEYREAQVKEKGITAKEQSFQFNMPGQVVESQNGTAAWLQANPAGAGTYAIWSCYADSTQGALAAITQAGRTDDLPIFTWDFSVSILPAIESGQVTTLYYSPDSVAQSVKDLILQYLKDGVPAEAEPSVTLVTKDNDEQFLNDNPGALEES
jgi:ABC-type sugar transport system substrate-binding protein